MFMLLLTHIIVAVSGLLAAAVALYTLSTKTIQLSYALTAGTIGTGTALVLFSGNNILKGCLSGLLYLTAILVMTSITKYRLATKKSDE